MQPVKENTQVIGVEIARGRGQRPLAGRVGKLVEVAKQPSRGEGHGCILSARARSDATISGKPVFL